MIPNRYDAPLWPATFHRWQETYPERPGGGTTMRLEHCVYRRDPPAWWRRVLLRLAGYDWRLL